MEVLADATSYEKHLMQASSQKGIPINGSMELLPLCNMNCKMCYIRLSRESMEKKGKIRSASEWLSMGREMAEAGTMYMLLTGGEPLLHPEFKDIYLGLKSLGMIITINTNGTLINEEWADFFAEYPPRKINITLYGTSRETYGALCHYEDGFERTLKAIELLQERGIHIRLGFSITEDNKHELIDYYQFCKAKNIHAISDAYMFSAVRERDDVFRYETRCNPEEAAKNRIYALSQIYGDEYPDLVERKIFEVENIIPEDRYGCMDCNAGQCSFAISWLGEMHPCVMMNFPSINTFEQGFSKSWDYIQSQTKKIQTSKQCQKCQYRPVCENCAASALVETGSHEGVSDYLCRYAKEMYRLYKLESVRLQNEEKI